MVVVSYSGKEINAKLVYYGAGLCGKTTNLEAIYEAVPDTSRGKMVSMKTQSDRTLFFDLLPLNLGEIMGFKTRFLLYTVPGQVFYNATRKLVLKGADAIVFVADSEIGKMDENKESLGNLRTNLAEYGVKLEDIPWVLQYNKRDLDNRYSIEELQKELNPNGTVPHFEAVAFQGKGVFETFRGISHMLLEKVAKDLRRTPIGGARKNDPATGRPEAPASTVISNPFAKAPAGTPASKVMPKPAPPSFGQVSLPAARQNAPGMNPAGEMPEMTFEDSDDAPEAVIETPASDDLTFQQEPPAPRPSSSAELRKPQRPAAPVRRLDPEPVGLAAAPPPARPVDGAPRTESRKAPLAPHETVIPIVVPRGSGGREIVIRIIVTEDEKAA